MHSEAELALTLNLDTSGLLQSDRISFSNGTCSLSLNNVEWIAFVVLYYYASD